MRVPVAVQQNQEISRNNEELRGLRSEFEAQVSKVTSGAFAIRRAFLGLTDKILAKIDEIKKKVEAVVIPASDFADFESGTVTLDQYADFDTLAYYNGLQRLGYGFHGVYVALIGISDIPQQPIGAGFTNDDSVIDVLDSDEFLEQGYTYPVYEAELSVKTYTILQGDTLAGIAAKILGDSDRWPEIAKLNDISNNDLIDGSLVGQKIRVPVIRTATTNRRGNNLVYEPFPEDHGDQKALDRYFYGRDLFVNSEKALEVGNNNDLRLAEGLDVVVGDVNRRFQVRKGNLNPLHPRYGLQKLNDSRRTPFVVALDRLLADMEGQAGSDPRVNAATVPRKNVSLKGDVLRADIDINLIGGSRSRRNVAVKF